MDTTYQTTSTATDGAVVVLFGIFVLVYIAIIALMIAGMWRLFAKAGKPGWAAIIPVYNQIVMLEIAGRPVWWVLINIFVPIFGWWTTIVSIIDFVKSYGKSLGYAVFVIFFPFIAYPMLGFSKSAQYIRPAAEGFDGFVPAPDVTGAAPVNNMPSTPPAPQA